MKEAHRRLESLDVFRGVTIAAMILVNNPGNWNEVFEPLVHAQWNGCTFADLVFPFFIFIAGVAMPLAFERRQARGADRRLIVRRIGRRAVALIGLGLILNAAAVLPHLAALRIPGVLQRIALAYFVAALIVLHTGAAGQAIAAAALLAAHWALLVWVPFGRYPAGTVTPLHNLPAYVDIRIFGRHMLTPTNDPEGLLGTLTTVATALLGALSGQWIRRASDGRRLGGLAVGGASALACGWAWSTVLPLNKPLWTGSYVMVTSGLAATALAVCYYLIDVRGRRRWVRPFIWLGVNPLAVYFLSELTGFAIDRPWISHGTEHLAVKDVVFWDVLAPRFGNTGGPWLSLVFAIGFTAIWIGVAGLMYRRGLRVQV